MAPAITLAAICFGLLFQSQGSIAGSRGLRNPPLHHHSETLVSSNFAAYRPQRVKVSYRQVTVPKMTENDGMGGFLDESAYIPCTDCLLTYISSSLEFPNGTIADADAGMWLHHAVFVNKGRADTVCPIGSYGQRFYATGNERTPIDISVGSTHKTGYYISKHDEVAISVELMNMRHQAQDVIFTTTYEFIPSFPKDFTMVTPVWLDVGGCGSSEVPAITDSVFNYSAPIWKGDIKTQGHITFAGSHLHDGGTHLSLFKNGEIICDAQPQYDSYNYYGHHHDNDIGSDQPSSAVSMERHVSKIPPCVNIGPTSSGDEYTLTAYYDTSLHAPMARPDGSLEPVMGIALFYIAQDSALCHHGEDKKTPGMHHRAHSYTISNSVLALGTLSFAAVLIAAWAKLTGYTWPLERRYNRKLSFDIERTDIKTPYSDS